MQGPSQHLLELLSVNRHTQDIGDNNDNEGRGNSSSSLDRTDSGDTSPIMNSPNKLRALQEVHMNTLHRLRSLGRVGTTKVDANDGTILSEVIIEIHEYLREKVQVTLIPPQTSIVRNKFGALNRYTELKRTLFSRAQSHE